MLRSTSHILHEIIFRSSGVAVIRISILSFCIERIRIKKKRNHIILINRNLFSDICWFTLWFAIYSLFHGIDYFISYIRVISNRLFIYSFWSIYNVFEFFIFPSHFLRNGYESIFDFFFTSQFQIHHLRISVSNSSRNKFDILSIFYFFFKKTFLFSKLIFSTYFRNILNLNFPKILVKRSWKSSAFQAIFFNLISCLQFCLHKKTQNTQTENDRIRSISRSIAKTLKSMMKCNHKFRVWTIMYDT